MSDYTTTAKIDLHINGNKVAEKLTELKQRASDFENAISKAAVAGDKVSLKKLRQELASTKKEIRNTENSAEAVAHVLSNLNKASPKELTSTLFTLNGQLKKMERGSQAWNQQVTKIKAVKAEIAKVNDSLRVNESFLSRCNNKLQTWGASIMGVAAGISGIVMAARQAVKAYGDMEEEKAQVRKFTGLTDEQVNIVNETFKKMDTRTARAELNKLAGEAGRLGKTSVKDVEGFVSAANIINVALDDLGEGATLSISKLTNIFGDEKILGTEKSMLAVGSVVNELSQNCTAAAPYLVDFTTRLAGVGSQSKMTIPQIMSFAAVLDSQGQKVEMSATAFSQLIMKMFQDPAKLANTLGMNVKKFTTTLKTSTNDALLMLLSRLKELGGMDVLTPIFKDMGVDGARASQVLSALAKEVNTVKSQQVEASKAFAEANSVTKEYNIQNNTVNANLDKAKKKFGEIAIELGEKLYPVMTHVISGSSALLRIIKFVVEIIDKYKVELVMLTATMVAYNIAINASSIKFNIHYGWLVLTKAATTALAISTTALKVVYYALTGQITKAKEAFVALNLITKASPWGAIAAVVTIVVASISALIVKLTETTAASKQLQEANNRLTDTTANYTKEIAKERNEIDRLFGKLDSAKKGTKEYEIAKKAILSQYGLYLKGLGAEIESLNNVAGAYKAITIAAEESAKARALESALKGEDDAYYNTVNESSKKINSGLKKARYVTHKEDRPLTQREITKWHNKIMDELQGDGLQNETIIFLKRIGVTDLLGDEDIFDGITSLKTAKSSMSDTKSRINSAFGNSVDSYEGLDIAQMQKNISSLDKLKSKMQESNRDGFVSLQNGKKLIFENVKEVDDEIKIATEYLKKLQDADVLEVEIIGIKRKANSNNSADDTNPKNSKPDKYASEKAWYEKEVALAKIAWSIGESDYQEYKNKLYELDEEFIFRKIDNSSTEKSEMVVLFAELAELEAKQREQFIANNEAVYKRDHGIRLQELKSMFADGTLSEQGYNEALFQEEIAHLNRLKSLTAQNSKERADIDMQINDKLLTDKLDKQKAYQKKVEDIKSKYFSVTPEENDTAYTEEMNILTQIYKEKLVLYKDDKDALLALEEQFQQAKFGIQVKYNKLGEAETTGAYNKAIQKSVEWLQSDAGKALTGSLDFLNQSVSAITSQLTESVKIEQEIQLAAVNKKYEQEISMAEGNSYKIKKLEKKKAEEEAKIKKEANRKMFAMQVIQAIATTAQGALNAYASTVAIPVVGPVLAPIAAAVAVATGLIQVANIKKQQQASESQGYYSGGYTRRGVDDRKEAGVVHQNEWVASSKLLRSSNTRPLIEALDYAQRTNTIGSLRSGNVVSVNIPQEPNSPKDAYSPYIEQALTLMSAEIKRLNDRLNAPFTTVNTVIGEHGIKAAQDEYDQYINNKSPKSKWK